MSLIGVVVVSAVLLMMVWMAVIMIKAQKLEGVLLPKTGTAIDELVSNSSKALLYFYSPNCAQCVSVTPVIDKMISEKLPVLKMDISKDPHVASALNIRATPTMLQVGDKKIISIILGAKSESAIRGLI